MNLEELQEQIEHENPRQLRIQGLKRKREESLHEFLILFFTKWNAEKSTLYVDDGEEQTDPSRRRSLGDIFMICKYYYPDVTLAEVVHELCIDLREHFSKGFRTSYCHTIFKRVWYFDENKKNLVYNKTNHDEYGNPWRYYLAFFSVVDEEPDEQDEDEAYEQEGFEDEEVDFDDGELYCCGDPTCDICGGTPL